MFRKPTREWLTLAEAARRAGVHRRDIMQAARKGYLTVQVPSDELERWIGAGYAALVRRVRGRRRQLRAADTDTPRRGRR